MKYFVGRMKDDKPFRVYSSKKYFTSEVVFRTDDLEEAKKRCRGFNERRKDLKTLELWSLMARE